MKLFVTGVGRSGTTLIQSILASHSGISAPPETHFFKRFILPSMLSERFRPSREKLKADQYLGRLPREFVEKTFDDHCREWDTQKLKEAFEAIMYSDRPSASLAMDKDTEYIRYVPHLSKIWPGSALLHIIRDPRDVVLSRSKAGWAKSKPLSFHLAEYAYYIKKVRKDGKQYFGTRYMEVRYEDLLTDPERTIQAVCGWLGIPYEKGMMNYMERGGQLVDREEIQWKGNVLKAIDTANVNKWRGQLSPSQIGLIEFVLGDSLRDMGYTPSGEKLYWTPAVMLVKVFQALFAWKTRSEKRGL